MHQGTPLRRFAAAACAAALCAGLAGCAPSEPVSRTDFFMSTLVTQQAYGRGAEEALARAAPWASGSSAFLYMKRTATCAASTPPRACSPCR